LVFASFVVQAAAALQVVVPRKLCCKDVNELDDRQLRKKVGGFFLEGCSDLTGKMGLPARLIREGMLQPLPPSRVLPPVERIALL
jgi:hypothetical protein